MTPRHVPVRVALVVAGLSPVLWGTAAMLDGRVLVEMSGVLSRASWTMTPEVDYLRKPLGIYVAMAGALLLYAAVDPVRHRAIVTWGALLLLGRGVQRVAMTSELHQVFAIPTAVNVLHGVYLLAVGATLLALRPRRVAPASAPRLGAVVALRR